MNQANNTSSPVTDEATLDQWKEMMPSWACDICDGDHMTVGAQLLTKDGRFMGNAFVMGIFKHKNLGRVASVITDAGHVLTMVPAELTSYFHPPKYIMKTSPALTGLRNELESIRYIGPHPPTRATDGSAGYDIRCTETKYCYNKNSTTLKTNLRLAIPVGYVALLKSRSGFAFRWSLETGAGVIDSDYRGEISILVHNLGDRPVDFKAGDRVCQMLIVPVASPEFVLVDSLDETDRAEGAYGHTGID